MSNVHLRRLNQSLSRRTKDLAASNRKLKKEIVRRKGMEQNLRQGKQRTVMLLAQSRQMQEQLRHLSRRILSAQEEERKRVSRELHDVIAQVLASINVRLALLKTETLNNTRGLAKTIVRTQKLVEKSVNIVHRFAYDLHPAALDYLGLIPALHSFMKNFKKETGIMASLTAFAKADQLEGLQRTVLFRVAQESLTNVARHAKASRVEVHIRQLPHAIRMDVSDNGRSFDASRILREGKTKHMGLLSMRERVEMIGGTFRIESAPGQGTTIHAQIPFYGVAKEQARA
ncbi:MAG: sensor histidine kinase [Magnetococcus sp. WYHC-3]